MQRCPRGCRPASPLAGYIDEPRAYIQGRQSIWIAPDGSDLDSSRDTHGWTAAVILGKKHPERPEVGYNAMLKLMTQGWIRMHLAHGSMHLHMATVPTPSQVATLRKYEAAGAVASTLEAGTDEYTSKLWHDDGVTRMTAGRIAAWVAQVLR